MRRCLPSAAVVDACHFQFRRALNTHACRLWNECPNLKNLDSSLKVQHTIPHDRSCMDVIVLERMDGKKLYICNASLNTVTY